MKPDIANQHNATLLPAGLHRVVDHFVTRRCCCDDHSICPESVGEPLDTLDK